MPAVTFGDAERVVAAGHKVIERHEEVGVALGRPQQVLLGAPAHRLSQRGRVQAEGPVQSFWRKTRGRGKDRRGKRRKQSETDGRKDPDDPAHKCNLQNHQSECPTDSAHRDSGGSRYLLDTIDEPHSV